jgi:DNA-binding GntR family transcriptional regulator
MGPLCVAAEHEQNDSRDGRSEPRGLLKENLALQLREEILSGRIAPGEKIIEGRWAREFGVAQISVREAINILTAEGFVTKGHGRSARVLRLRDPDIMHIYHVRGALEGLAARLVAERKLPLQDLELAQLQMIEAVRTNDIRKVVDRVQHFHVCLLEKPGNPFILEYGRRLVIPLYAFTLMRALAKNLDASPWAQQLPNHQRIIDAIQMGNPWLAEQVVIHVTNLFLDSALKVWAH